MNTPPKSGRENSKVAVIIEARMTSSRLPGKIMLPAHGKPMLEHLVNRLKQVKSIGRIVLATTTNKTDDCLVEFAKQQGIALFRGSEEDVLNRVIGAAESVSADIVVEVTSDCPIIDPLLVEQCIQMFLHNSCDFLSNGPIAGKPASCGYPIGMISPVVWLEVLKRSAAMTTDPLDHEHVMLYIHNHPEQFRHLYLIAPGDLYWPELALTLDEPRDYELLKKIIEHFGDANPYFSCREVIELLKTKPEWVAINKDVRRTAVVKQEV